MIVIKQSKSYLILSVLLLLCVLRGSTQILAINKPLFSDAPFFNALFVKQNKIKAISGSISSKKVSDIIRSNNQDCYYLFNRDGTLKSQLLSHFTKGIKDTTVIAYEYKNNKISLKRKNDNNGFFSYNYTYNKEQELVSQTYCREENKFNSKRKFELKKKYTIVKDSFSYQKLDGQTKKIFYNHYHKKYKIQTNTYDSLGYLKEEFAKFIIGNKKEKATYEYDEYGRLIKKHTYTDIARNIKNTSIYAYDTIGNVLSIKYFINEKHHTTKQFLYDKNMLLSAMIVQEIESNFLNIIKYRYTFY